MSADDPPGPTAQYPPRERLDRDEVPALNEIERQALDESPKYDDGDRMYMILFDDDYHKHGVDMDGNVALLLDRENAKEVRELAEGIIEALDDAE